MKRKTFIFDSDALKGSMRIRTNSESLVKIVSAALYLVDEANFCHVHEVDEMHTPMFRPELSFGVKEGNGDVPELPLDF